MAVVVTDGKISQIDILADLERLEVIPLPA
jgi:hypothetical protein